MEATPAAALRNRLSEYGGGGNSLRGVTSGADHGIGPPAARDPEARVRDFREGYVTR